MAQLQQAWAQEAGKACRCDAADADAPCRKRWRRCTFRDEGTVGHALVAVQGRPAGGRLREPCSQPMWPAFAWPAVCVASVRAELERGTETPCARLVPPWERAHLSRSRTQHVRIPWTLVRMPLCVL